MAEETQSVESVETVGDGPLSEVTHDDLVVVSNNESAEDMKANFESDKKPLDGEPEPEKDEKTERSEAAAKLGKAGGEAAAKAKAEKEADEKKDGDEPKKAVEDSQAVDKADAKADEDGEKAPGVAEEEKPRSSARARVEQATRKLAEERRLREAAEAEVARLKAPAPEPEAARPLRAEFANEEDYFEALTDWKTDQKMAEYDKRKERERMIAEKVEADRRQVEAFNERLGKVDPKRLEDAAEVFGDMVPTSQLPPNTPPGPDNDIAQMLFESEHTGDLMLFLMENPEELERLRQMPDSFAVARAMGGLEYRATHDIVRPGPVPVPAPTVSKAKPPVRPIQGSPQYSEEDVSDDMDFDEHVRVMNAREQRARRGR